MSMPAGCGIAALRRVSGAFLRFSGVTWFPVTSLLEQSDELTLGGWIGINIPLGDLNRRVTGESLDVTQ